MFTFKKRLVTIIFLSLISIATLVSCGKQANQEQQAEHPADSTEHPTDSEHPSDTTKASHEHPADTTKK